MKTWKNRIVVVGFCICLGGLSACGQAARYTDKIGPVIPLMESSAAGWTEIIAENCFIRDFGRPYGTKSETLEKKQSEDGRNIWSVIFDLDEPATEAVIKGYAKSIWDACVKADGDRMHSANRYYYDSIAEAKRRQEPVDYYLWYYFAKDGEFRVSVCATEMETGAKGGIVLRIEEWVHK